MTNAKGMASKIKKAKTALDEMDVMHMISSFADFNSIVLELPKELENCKSLVKIDKLQHYIDFI